VSAPTAGSRRPERAAKIVRERTGAEAERLHREAYDYHRSAREEIMRMSQAAQERAEKVRAEAEAHAQRARDEVAALAAQREDISRQLGDLHAVIEALSVPEVAAARAAADRVAAEARVAHGDAAEPAVGSDGAGPDVTGGGDRSRRTG
jgi:chromosome segregation ATPase